MTQKKRTFCMKTMWRGLEREIPRRTCIPLPWKVTIPHVAKRLAPHSQLLAPQVFAWSRVFESQLPRHPARAPLCVRCSRTHMHRFRGGWFVSFHHNAEVHLSLCSQHHPTTTTTMTGGPKNKHAGLSNGCSSTLRIVPQETGAFTTARDLTPP